MSLEKLRALRDSTMNSTPDVDHSIFRLSLQLESDAKEHAIPGMFFITDVGVSFVGWQPMSGLRVQPFSIPVSHCQGRDKFNIDWVNAYKRIESLALEAISRVILSNPNYLQENPEPRTLWINFQENNKWPYDR